ncbi:hypothetical protein [Companilactobacillus heilongjiangensis]|uniref:DUF5067 domain-containing protein n=1 Tax=Companilactobacillus heilongjiangensis TaxID=1074467 RepID=A0A0K2LB06_9LACO|nr:hypothetical protein [Companilactobacillus heilongjiangensis]ALB28476.1 hypothetical protein JP39_03365 [Companilactobacillus heilongjiangensis]
MKKFFLPLVSILLIGVVLTGCSTTSNQSAKINTKKTEVAKTATSYYQSLNKADKKKIIFKFSQDQDETSDNSADPVYAISLKITNNTKKIVKFDQSKFIVFVSETTKFPSTKSGIITLKPGKSVSINQLIEKVSEQALVGNDSYFIYMNMDNKLAKTLTVVPKASVQNNTGTDSSNDVQQSQDNSSAGTNDSTTGALDNTDDSQSQEDGSSTVNNSFDKGGNPQVNPNVTDGGISDRIAAWQEEARQEALNQGMSDSEANDYSYKVAWQKENAFEESLDN